MSVSVGEEKRESKSWIETHDVELIVFLMSSTFGKIPGHDARRALSRMFLGVSIDEPDEEADQEEPARENTSRSQLERIKARKDASKTRKRAN